LRQPTDRDRYRRLLRYAWLDVGDGEVYLVNEALVRSGHAALFTVSQPQPPQAPVRW